MAGKRKSVCPNCNTQIPYGAFSCSNCRTRLEQSVERPAFQQIATDMQRGQTAAPKRKATWVPILIVIGVLCAGCNIAKDVIMAFSTIDTERASTKKEVKEIAEA